MFNMNHRLRFFRSRLLVLLVLVAAGPALAAQSFSELRPGNLPPVQAPELTEPRFVLEIGGLAIFVDEHEFFAGCPFVAVEDFEGHNPIPGVLACPGPFNSETNDACFSPGALQPGFSFDAVPLGGDGSMAVIDTGFLGATSSMAGPNFFADDGEVVFDPPVTGLGVRVSSLGGPVFQIRLYDESDQLMASIFFPPPLLPDLFFVGVRSDTPIARMETIGVQAELIDRLAFGRCERFQKELIDGNDLDFDGEIDRAVEVGTAFAGAEYRFGINYFDPNGPAVVIKDVVPREWNVQYDGLIKNGGFETGDLSGWGTNSAEIIADNGTFVPPGPGGSVPPLEGFYSAAWFQDGAGVRTLYQDIVVPAGGATLSWWDHIENWNTDFVDPDQEWRVEVRDPGSDALLGELFSTNPGDPLTQGWTYREADLSPWAGTLVRLAFTEEDNLWYFNVRLDAVRVDSQACSVIRADERRNLFSDSHITCGAANLGYHEFSAQARCFDEPGNPACHPKECGAFFLNQGAGAYVGRALLAVTDPICLAAVRDLDGGGIDYSGNGDEDGDGVDDYTEACIDFTDPCSAPRQPR